MNRDEIAEGDIYTPYEDDGRKKSRRVLGVLNNTVVYSTGGMISRTCKIETMRRWLRESDAIKASKDQNNDKEIRLEG